MEMVVDKEVCPGGLSEFDAALKDAHMLGQWRFEEALNKAKNGPPSYGIPYVWTWEVVHRKLMDACRVLPKSNDARRNLSFRNPATNGGAATQAVSVGMQAVVPGEVCWAHRHSIDAMRFAVAGNSGLYTVVDGEKMTLETGDLVLTPAYTWHDHHNEGDSTGIWLDVLNTPTMFALNQIFYEEFGEEQQPRRAGPWDGLSVRGGLLRPAWERTPRNQMAFRYPWSAAQAALRELAGCSGSPQDGVVLRYANPFNGGSTLATLDVALHLLKPAQETKRHRKTSSAIYYVVEGEGVTEAGDHVLKWKTGDTFCVPNWLWHRHVNTSANGNAVLFTVNDSPTLQKLGLYREEPVHSPGSLDFPAVPAHAVRPDPSDQRYPP